MIISDYDSDSEEESLRCNECDVSFVNSRYLHNHLLFHIRQPAIVLEKLPSPPPIKLTFKSTSDNSFVVFSPSSLYSPKSQSGESGATTPVHPTANTDTTVANEEAATLAEFEEADESHQDSGVGSIDGANSVDGIFKIF